MMKPLLLASAFALAAPALAQDMGNQPPTGTTRTTTTPTPPVTRAPPVSPNADAATTATPSEVQEMRVDTDESEDSMTTTPTESMSDRATMSTDVDATRNSNATAGAATSSNARQGNMPTQGTPPAQGNTSAMSRSTVMGQGADPGMAMGGPANWAEFDSDNDGMLTPLEFGKMVMDAGGQPVGDDVEATRRSRDSDLPAIQVLNSTSRQLVAVDTDGNWMVSQAELQAYQPE